MNNLFFKRRLSKWFAIFLLISSSSLYTLGKIRAQETIAVPLYLLSQNQSYVDTSTDTPLTVHLFTDATGITLSAAEIHLEFDDQFITPISLEPGPALTTILTPAALTATQASITIGAPISSTPTGVIHLATFKIQTTQTPGESQIKISSNTQLAAIGYNYNIAGSLVPITINVPLPITPTPTPSSTPTPTLFTTLTPTSSPTPTITPTLSPTPSPTSTPSLTPTTTPTVSPTHTPTPTLTPSPTITPTQIPTLVPTVSATATLTPTISPPLSTITPTPQIINEPPLITTKALPFAFIQKPSYRARIRAQDPDGDRLRMRISNLPWPLKQQYCVKPDTLNSDIECYIAGFTPKAGIYPIEAQVIDSNANIATKKFWLISLNFWDTPPLLSPLP